MSYLYAAEKSPERVAAPSFSRGFEGRPTRWGGSSVKEIGGFYGILFRWEGRKRSAFRRALVNTEFDLLRFFFLNWQKFF